MKKNKSTENDETCETKNNLFSISFDAVFCLCLLRACWCCCYYSIDICACNFWYIFYFRGLFKLTHICGCIRQIFQRHTHSIFVFFSFEVKYNWMVVNITMLQNIPKSNRIMNKHVFMCGFQTLIYV